MQELEQRIRYLIEHGGVLDDPLDDIRRRARWHTRAVIALLVFNTAEVLLLLYR